jgi:hypothetical protein
MNTEPRGTFEPGSPVWVWDTTWLPAVVLDRAQKGRLLLGLDHGVTFIVTTASVEARDPRASSKPEEIEQTWVGKIRCSR